MTEGSYRLIKNNPMLTFGEEGDLIIPANLIKQVQVGEAHSWIFDNIQLILIPQMSTIIPSLSNIISQLEGPRKPYAGWSSLEELRKCRERNTY